MTATKNKSIDQILDDMEVEIFHYNIRKPIKDAMWELGHMGFKFSGHGCGCGGEDFNVVNESKNLYVNFCDRGRSCEVCITTCNDECPTELFKGTINKALDFIKKKIKKKR